MSRSKVAQIFATEWPVLVAALRRDLGDLGLAEEAAQEAFTEAAARWGPDSTPDKPGAWLLTTARRKAIDQVRRNRRFADRLPALVDLATTPPPPPSRLIDDQLALVFGCCHSSLDTETQIALTLRQVCGLSTAQIAQAFLVSTATMTKRLTRAKGKIRAAGVPFSVPGPDELDDRLAAVLHVVYLIFTAGHTSSEGDAMVRGDLCDEARWLASVVDDLLARRPGGAPRSEVQALAALMLFTDARRATRVDDRGAIVLLEHQDRSRWDRAMIAEAQAVLATALATGHLGRYQVQAAIAGLHATAATWADTDWPAIVALYDTLLAIDPGPVVELNRAVAVSLAAGPAEGLVAIDAITARGELDDYRYLHAARADMLRRLDHRHDAAIAYRRALDLGGNEAERRFLTDRLAQLDELGRSDRANGA